MKYLMENVKNVEQKYMEYIHSGKTYEALKVSNFIFMALKPIKIRWIRTGSQPYCIKSYITVNFSRILIKNSHK